MGPGRRGELRESVRAGRVPRGLRARVPVPDLDQQPDRNQPDGLRGLHGERDHIRDPRRRLPVGGAAAVAAAGPVLAGGAGLVTAQTDMTRNLINGIIGFFSI